MNKILLFLVSACIAIIMTGCPGAYNPPIENELDLTGSADTWTDPGGSWNLVWEDTFDGPNINTANWSYDIGQGTNGWGNNEWEVYTNSSANSFIQDGKLVIKAIKSFQGNGGYTSARMKTQGKLSWKYGLIAARIKLPFGQGIWPAFWMLGDNIGSVGWPACGEIDIMEMIGGGENRDDTVYSTLHWDNGGSHASYGLSKELPDPDFFYEDYHYFEIEWDANNVRTRLDGIEFYVIDINPAGLSEFHSNFFIILNLAVGGNWPGYPNTSTLFPQFLIVDWVKVYQKP
ncbi:MAG: glycoside hydrolase family 16 protein [Spirochaetales bacterium]|nr:glycoside hydrolase family 16 protein [Spirochaetales bacterium]